MGGVEADDEVDDVFTKDAAAQVCDPAEEVEPEGIGEGEKKKMKSLKYIEMVPGFFKSDPSCV